MIVTILVGILCFLFARLIAVAFWRGIRDIPGPVIARFTPLFRMTLVFSGNAVQKYRRLHERYGPFVRTGPNSVAIADPRAIPIIYGISSKFRKVCVNHENPSSQLIKYGAVGLLQTSNTVSQ